MSFTFGTSSAIVTHAGANVSSTAATSAAILELFSNEAEAFINSMTKEDWISKYASVGANFKNMLATAHNCLGAIDLITYDMSGYTTRGEAESMINILHDKASRAITRLNEDKVKTEMGITDS